jgi:hypothetical protein
MNLFKLIFTHLSKYTDPAKLSSSISLLHPTLCLKIFNLVFLLVVVCLTTLTIMSVQADTQKGPNNEFHILPGMCPPASFLLPVLTREERQTDKIYLYVYLVPLSCGGQQVVDPKLDETPSLLAGNPGLQDGGAVVSSLSALSSSKYIQQHQRPAKMMITKRLTR